MAETKEDNIKEVHPNSVFGNMNFPVSMNWSKREYALGGIVIGVFVIVFILAGFLGASNNSSTSSTCKTIRCIEMSGYMMYTMNKSVDPCDDFYQYACGQYAATKGIKSGRTSRSTMNDIYDRNQEKLKNLLEAPTDRATEWSSEMKLKDLFNSCLDDFTKEKLRGRPFTQKILPKMGGWYVLNNWNKANFDLNKNLKIVQTDLWVGAFWYNGVGYDWTDYSKRVVQLYPAGAGRYMGWSFYTRTDNTQVKVDYKKFMRRIANLIVRDSGLPADAGTPGRIEDFINDAFGMETKLAQLYMKSPVSYDRYASSERISLNALKTQTGGVIDWVDQMQYEFPNALTGDSQIILFKKDFIMGLSSLINNLNGPTKNRMLHNYLIWRMMENYAQELSWEYVHANREYYVDIWGSTTFQGTWRYCFRYAYSVMPEALGSLYVRDHFADKNKDKSHEITDYITKALRAEISDNKILDVASKKLAQAKLAKTVYKLGYPQFMLSPTKLDNIYKSLTINVSDFFQNVLNINQFKKVYYDNQLAQVDKTQWLFKTFDTSMAVLFYWNEIIVPAGFLQFPLYDYNNPHFVNFGSMGTIVAHFITHVVDELGQYWDGDGKRTTQSWWTNGTKSSYQKVKQCVINYYTNQTQGPFKAPNGAMEYIPIKPYYASEAISITTGVKLAMRAYKMWEKDNGNELPAPVLGLTNEQLFFVSHAQSYCYNRNNNQAYVNAVRGRVEEDMRINLALSQLPEFADAFKCKAGSKMNAPSKCGYF